LENEHVEENNAKENDAQEVVQMVDFQEKGDERLVPDLPRGRGRSIGGDLDIDEEGFE
jgi:hypothetical protein